MRVAPAIVLTEDQERTLQQWSRGRSLPARQVERARVVLLAAAGKQDLEIAAENWHQQPESGSLAEAVFEGGIGGIGGIGEGCTPAWPYAEYSQNHCRPRESS